MRYIINEKGQQVEEYEGLKEFFGLQKSKKAFAPGMDLNDKILVLKHTWGIGDCFFLTAAIRALKTEHPQVYIAVIVRYTDIFRGNPDVDEILDWRLVPDNFEMSRRFKDRGKDWILLDYDCMLKAGYDLRLHSRQEPVFNDYIDFLSQKDYLEPYEEAFLRQSPTSTIREYGIPVLDLYAKHAGVELTEKTVFYFPSARELQKARTLLDRAQGAKKIVLVPRTSTLHKDYPHWAEVIAAFPECSWFIVGNAWGECPTLPNVYNLTESCHLRDSLALCLEADLLCSGDTGCVYPRAALGKPCLVICGAVEPWGFYSYFPSVLGLRIDALRTTSGMQGFCSVGCMIDTLPCFPGSPPPPCLQELGAEVVISKVNGLLA